MNAAAPAIVVENLVRTFGPTRAVDGLSLEVRRGEVLGFLGHNGAGKTTTVRLLNGVLSRDAGRVEVLGHDPEREGEAVRRRAGVLTESPAVDDRFTARENLAFFARLYDVEPARARARIDQLLGELDLLPHADQRAGGFSKGMKQKLALARALLHEPEVLYLDEPTSGLDPVASRGVSERVRKLAHEEGRTVLFCTHRLLEAEQLCDRLAIVSRGKLVALGTLAELTRSLTPEKPPLELEVGPGEDARLLALVNTLAGAEARREADGSFLVEGIARDDVPAFVARLVAEGLRVFRVAGRQTRLEDVYLALQENAPERTERTERTERNERTEGEPR